MKKLIHFILPLGVFVAWELFTRFGDIPGILLPPPKEVFDAFVGLCRSGELAEHIGMSAFRTMTGFVLASLTGVLLGVGLACSETSHRLLNFTIEALRLTPPLALIPLLILWLGIDEAPKIAIVFLSSFFPIYLNTFNSVRGVDPKLKELARLLNFSPSETFRLLTLPASIPGILTGLRLGFGYSWRALVGAELIAAASGLGFMISESAEFGKTETVFVGILTIVVLGIGADKLISWLFDRTLNVHGGLKQK